MDFSKSSSRGGAKSGEIRFSFLETKKTTFFAEIFKFLPLFPHPCLCARPRHGKVPPWGESKSAAPHTKN